MLDPIIDLLTSNTSLPSLWGRVVVIAALFGVAFLVSRVSAWIARRILAWHDRKTSDTDLEATRPGPDRHNCAVARMPREVGAGCGRSGRNDA